MRGPHMPLWTDELWEQIQAVRRRSFRGTNGGKLRNIYPLRRLAVCDRCGRKMYGEPHEGVTYMACIVQRERHACDQRAVRSSRLEDEIERWLTTLRLPEDWRDDIEKMQRGIAKARDERPAVDRARIADQLDRLNDLYLMAAIGREEYVGRKRALDATLLGGRPQPTYSEAVLVRAARLLNDLAALWSEANPGGTRRTRAEPLCRSPGPRRQARRREARPARLPAAHRLSDGPDSGWCGAPGRTRTADAGLRTASLYPLSYGGVPGDCYGRPARFRPDGRPPPGCRTALP